MHDLLDTPEASRRSAALLPVRQPDGMRAWLHADAFNSPAPDSAQLRSRVRSQHARILTLEVNQIDPGNRDDNENNRHRPTRLQIVAIAVASGRHEKRINLVRGQKKRI